MISIIVPVYQVEPYLNRCVRSLLEQTYTDVEIILVDDGSPDGCPTLCDAWAGKDARVIHKPNGGLSDARNAGLTVARGEEIAFVDSDDWVDPDMLERLYNQMEETGADLAACGVTWEYPGGRSEVPHPLEDRLYTGRRAIMRAYIQTCMVRTTVWNKLYRRAVVDKLFFPAGKTNEDEFFTYRVLDRTDRVSVLSAPMYHYRQRQDSIMGVYSLRRLDILEAMEGRLSFLEEKYPELLPQERRNQLAACLYHYRQLIDQPEVDPEGEGRRRVRQYVRRVGLKLTDLRGCSAGNAARVLAIRASVSATAGLYQSLHKKL